MNKKGSKHLTIGDCKTLLRWPYVCNGCQSRQRCMFRARYEYSAKEAQPDYERTLSESRDGVDMTPEDMAYMEERMREAAEKGRSPASEFVAHEGEMPCSLCRSTATSRTASRPCAQHRPHKEGEVEEKAAFANLKLTHLSRFAI